MEKKIPRFIDNCIILPLRTASAGFKRKFVGANLWVARFSLANLMFQTKKKIA